MGKIFVNLQNPELESIRQVIFERIRNEPNWNQLDPTGMGYSNYIEVIGLKSENLFYRFADVVLEVFWQFVIEGILVPGKSVQSPSLPWFHVTKYGKKIIQSVSCNPHDPTGYLFEIKQKIQIVDDTVMAYLKESLDSLRHGLPVASAIMLGVAAERVFILVSESLLDALTDSSEKNDFEKILKRNPMKPKLDWVHCKFEKIRSQRNTPVFPEDAILMIMFIYELIRHQRNEIGHPRNNPPSLTKEDVFTNLKIFPAYYQKSEVVRNFFKEHKV